MQGIWDARMAACKASDLPTVLSLWTLLSVLKIRGLRQRDHGSREEHTELAWIFGKSVKIVYHVLI